MHGIGRIQKTIFEAQALRHAEQMDRIHTRLGFLEYRHPAGEDLSSAA